MQPLTHPRETSPSAPAHRTAPQSAVMLDPYAHAVLSRRHWGQLAPDLPWDQPGVLGFAPTWPQAAGALPVTGSFDWEGAWAPGMLGVCTHPAAGRGRAACNGRL